MKRNRIQIRNLESKREKILQRFCYISNFDNSKFEPEGNLVKFKESTKIAERLEILTESKFRVVEKMNWND